MPVRFWVSRSILKQVDVHRALGYPCSILEQVDVRRVLGYPHNVSRQTVKLPQSLPTWCLGGFRGIFVGHFKTARHDSQNIPHVEGDRHSC